MAAAEAVAGAAVVPGDDDGVLFASLSDPAWVQMAMNVKGQILVWFANNKAVLTKQHVLLETNQRLINVLTTYYGDGDPRFYILHSRKARQA